VRRAAATYDGCLSAGVFVVASPHHKKILQCCALVLVALASGGAVAPYAELSVEACEPDEVIQAAPDQAQQALTAYLSRRFMIAPEATGLMVETAHRAATEVGLDPLLVLAVIAVESRFNPVAQSVMGAKGLMQIIPRYHRAKLEALGGDEAVLDPQSNILVGTRILQEYVYRTGTLEAGLQSYNGASRDGSAQYAYKVMAERSRLEQVLRGGGA
jgi:soluble lytic murein transglycosylase-like protein